MTEGGGSLDDGGFFSAEDISLSKLSLSSGKLKASFCSSFWNNISQTLHFIHGISLNDVVLKIQIMKESLNSDGKQFIQYQQNEYFTHTQSQSKTNLLEVILDDWSVPK